MTRKDRRVQQLAERRQLKKGAPLVRDEAFAWMAGLLPAPAGTVIEVAADPRGTAALKAGGWNVVPVETGAVLAPGAFGGAPVDALTCWLLDLRVGRPDVMERLAAMGLQNADERRLAVQTLVYRLADRVLRPGGILQVVDRTSEAFGESLAAGMVRLQRAQAAGTALELAAIDARPDAAGAFVSVRSRKGRL